MTIRNFPRFSLCFAACLFAGIPLAAPAQTPADIERAQTEAARIQQQEQLRQQREREEALRRRPAAPGIDPRLLAPEVKAPALGPACRDIREIVVSGAPNLPAMEREALLAPYLNRCLAVADIEKLLSAITRHYVDRGYITTRVYIPQQDLSKGRLEVLVVEGVVEKIMLRDGAGGSVAIANAFPGVEGAVLNLRDIEQGLDQINRLAANDASMEILPGSRPGGSVVAIANRTKPSWRVGLSYDNQGTASTGREQAGVNASADNLLGFGDFASLAHREALPGDRERRYSLSDSLSYVLPYGYNTFSLGASASRYVSTVSTSSGLELQASGDSSIVFGKLERVVYRDQTTRANLAATLTNKDAKNYLAGQLLEVSSRKLTVLDIDASLSTGLLGGVLGIDLGHARGLAILGALDDLGNLPDSAPRAQFRKFKYGLSYSLPFKLAGLDAAWSSQLSGQHAAHVLYGSEQVLIGGIYTVRGFVANTLSGDNGYFWRNDVSLRLPAPAFGQDGVLKPFVAFDQGRVKQHVAGLAPEGALSGVAVGAVWSVGAVSLEVFNSRPLTLPDWMRREGSATYFRLSLTL